MKNLVAARSAWQAVVPLLIWLFASTSQADMFGGCCFGSPQTSTASAIPVVTTSGFGTSPSNTFAGVPTTSFSPIMPAGFPQTNFAHLPTGGYASQYYRAPTTYYRPVTSLDPATGTMVTSLQPCSSFQYQAQRVPLLVPSWSNYAYGGYGTSTFQNRWSPITAPSIDSTSGQSTLSIASGMGSMNGTTPVTQLPQTGVAINTAPSLPSMQAVTSGFGGAYFSQPAVATNAFGSGSAVVPAAAWTAPTTPQYSSTPTNGGAYASSYGGYFGSVPQTFTQPAMVAPSLPGSVSNYTPSGPSTNVNGVTITPIGPAVTSPYPTSPYQANPYGNGSPMPSQAYPSAPTTVSGMPDQPTYPSSILPNSSYGYGAMPGSMGQPVMPSAVSPTVGSPSSSVFPPVMPSTPAPISDWTPSPSTTSPSPSTPSSSSGTSNLQDAESTIAPSLLPSTAESRKPEASDSEPQPRFQLRSVERDPPVTNPSPSVDEAPKSPWTTQKNEASKQLLPDDQSSESSKDTELKLNMESLRPIPAPNNFDATPDWKPALLNARDQTAGTDPRIRRVNQEIPKAGIYHEVRFLNGTGDVEPTAIDAAAQVQPITAVLRPMPSSNGSVVVPPLSTETQSLNTTGWSTVLGR